jgi:hypothetical protein
VATDDRILVEEPRDDVSILDLVLRARRDTGDYVRVELRGSLAMLVLASLELSRRFESDEAWTLLGGSPQRSGETMYWFDPLALSGGKVHYRLRARLASGSDSAWITREAVFEAFASGHARLRASPNPFHGAVALRVPLDAGEVLLRVYDPRGRLVRRLDMSQAVRETASWRWDWDGLDAAGNAVARGIYVVELTASGRLVHSRIVKLDR